MKKYLVEFNDNWADEFNVKGFKCLSEVQLENFNKALEELEYPIEFYFGTNEWIEYDSKEELERTYKIKEISTLELGVIGKYFPMATTYGYGIFCNPCVELERQLEEY